MVDLLINKFLFCVDTNECDGDPCINGATCNDDVNSYTCDCAAGYTGQYCEIGRWLSKELFALHTLRRDIIC